MELFANEVFENEILIFENKFVLSIIVRKFSNESNFIIEFDGSK